MFVSVLLIVLCGRSYRLHNASWFICRTLKLKTEKVPKTKIGVNISYRGEELLVYQFLVQGQLRSSLPEVKKLADNQR